MIVEKWRRFRRLGRFERRIVVQAAIALPITRVALRLAGFQLWKNTLARLASSGVEDLSRGLSKLELARLIARMETVAAGNLFFEATCLERSIVLWWLLRNRGIPVELFVGARKQRQRFEAHAWVEFEGRVLSDDADVHDQFVPFDHPIISS